MEKKQSFITQKELAIAISVGICFLLSYFIPNYQATTASITVLLIAQTRNKFEWKPALKRLAATGLGGFIAVLIVLIDTAISNKWLLVLLVLTGTWLSMFICRLLKMPAYSDRVSCITFILVMMVNSGKERIPYAIFRMLSTLGGAIVEMLVSAIIYFFVLYKGKIKEKGSIKSFINQNH